MTDSNSHTDGTRTPEPVRGSGSAGGHSHMQSRGIKPATLRLQDAGSASEPQSDPAEEKYCFNVCTFATDVLKLAELIKQKLI